MTLGSSVLRTYDTVLPHSAETGKPEDAPETSPRFVLETPDGPNHRYELWTDFFLPRAEKCSRMPD